ncbi:hypothetical protein CLOM_g15048 [Closterium sp. NIES-68]|nr:hypothetical protein CLOM_g15048 [Closterium sp. NIES-68]GJP76233.1 hypothetical protein CLOP_g6605 [Closterium sp. NIES-67]
MASSWPSVPPCAPTSRLSSCMSGSLPQRLWDRSEGGMDELRALSIRNNPPSIVFDNVSDERSTLVKVGSASRHGCLLEVVQLLSDLNLLISKAFISSDAAWFVDVFHVRDSAGEKLRDRRLMAYIQRALGAPSFEEVAPSAASSPSLRADASARPPAPHLPAPPHHAHSAYATPTRSISANQTLSAVPLVPGTLSSFAASAASASTAAATAAAAAGAGASPGAGEGAAPPAACCLASSAHTTIEITGGDRPGILANVAAVLAAAQCNVVGAEVWTHNGRVACVVCVTDNTAGGGRIKDPLRLQRIRAELAAIVRPAAAAAASPSAVCHAAGTAPSAPATACLLPPQVPPPCPHAPASASPTSSLSPGLSPPLLPPRPPTAIPPYVHSQIIPAAPPNSLYSAAPAATGTLLLGAEVAVQGGRGSAGVETGRQAERPVAAAAAAVAAVAKEQMAEQAAEQRALQAAMQMQRLGGVQTPSSATAAGGGVWTDVEWDSVAWRGDMRERGRAERGGGGLESTSLPVTMAHAERRLHQLLFADRDYEDTTPPPPMPAAAAPTAPAPLLPAAAMASGGGPRSGLCDAGVVESSEMDRRGGEQGVTWSQRVQPVQMTRQALMPRHAPLPSPHSFAQPALSSSPLFPPAAAAAAVAVPSSLPPAVPTAAAVPSMPPHPSRPAGGPGMAITAPMGWAASGLPSQVVSTEPGAEQRASGLGRQGCVGAAGAGSGGAWVGGRLMGSRAPATGGVVGRRGRRGGAIASTGSTTPGFCSTVSGSGGGGNDGGGSGVRVSVRNSVERQYSVVRVRCHDRPKLLFDTVCTLTDMGYMVHHGAISSHKGWAMQEYYIRQMDGGTLESEAERQRVIKCVEAAIERRTPKGVHLEVCVGDRAGLLSDVTRVLLSEQLSVAAANVSTRGATAVDHFIVTHPSGRPVDVPRVLAAVRRHMGPQAQVTVTGVAAGDEGEEGAGEVVGSGGSVSGAAAGSGGSGGQRHAPGMPRSRSCGWQPSWGGKGAAGGTGAGSSSRLGPRDRQLGGNEGEESGEDEFGLADEDEDEGWGVGGAMFGSGEGGDEGEADEEGGESSSILGAVWRQSEWLLSSLGFGTKAHV